MPHFVIECSENVLQLTAPDALMAAVYEEAESTGLFAKNDVKVRITPFSMYKIVEGMETFLHVFANIMEGRTTEQKADLSKRIVTRLNALLPNLSILSMNVREFERATYTNKGLIDPRNTSGDRHFGLPK